MSRFAIGKRAVLALAAAYALAAQARAQESKGERPRPNEPPFREARGSGSLIRLDCKAAGEWGLAIDLSLPEKPRHGEKGAPVVVVVPGAFSPGGLGRGNGSDLTSCGFAMIRVTLPGHRVSGGTYDSHGPACAEAIESVALFASGRTRSLDGRTIGEHSGAIRIETSNVGLLGLANGGSLAVNAIARFQGREGGSPIAWLVNWESPLGEGMANAECGARRRGPALESPEVNPAYDPKTGQWTFDRLAWSSAIAEDPFGGGPSNAREEREVVPKGVIYVDANGNGTLDRGVDFAFRALVVHTKGLIRFYYSARLLEEVERRKLYPDGKRPSHIPTAAEARAFWADRDGALSIRKAVEANRKLLFLGVASAEDHLQGAPDHPHVLIQHQGFLDAGARLVRLNPDRAYVEWAMGRECPTAVDNPAGKALARTEVTGQLEPSPEPRPALLQIAACCELSDRTAADNVTPQLDRVLYPDAPGRGRAEAPRGQAK